MGPVQENVSFPTVKVLPDLKTDELRALLKRKDCPSPIVDWIRVNAKDHNLGYKGWGHPNLPQNVLEEEIEAIINTSGQIRYGSWGITNNPNLTTEMLTRMALSGHPVYDHPNFDMTFMLECFETANKDSRKLMASNINLSQVMQDKLSTSNVAVRATLARNQHITVTTMRTLADDTSFHVIRSLLDNPTAGNLKTELLARICGMDTHYSVSKEKVFAKHSHNPDEVRGYCLHPHPKVRRAAVRNPACPEEGLIAAALLEK